MRRKRTEFWHRITEPLLGNGIVVVRDDGSTVRGTVVCIYDEDREFLVMDDHDNTHVFELGFYDHLEGLWSETPAEYLEETDQ